MKTHGGSGRKDLGMAYHGGMTYHGGMAYHGHMDTLGVYT